MIDLSNIHNLNDKKVYILLQSWDNKKKCLKNEENRLRELYGVKFNRDYDIAYNLCSEGYLHEYNDLVSHDKDGNENILPLKDRFCLTEIGKNAIVKDVFPSETKTRANELKRIKWADRRSWIALFLSLIAVIISLLA